MKIYRNITLAGVIFVLIISLLLPLIFIPTGLYSFEDLLSPEIIMMMYSLAATIFFMTTGDIAFTRFYKDNAGYKYFRSIPNAYERLKAECIRTDIISLTIILANLIPLFMTGFENILFIAIYILCMLMFAVYHFINSSSKASSSTSIYAKGASGGMVGMIVSFIAITMGEHKEITIMPKNVVVIIITSVTLLAFISLIPLYANLKKKWEAE